MYDVQGTCMYVVVCTGAGSPADEQTRRSDRDRLHTQPVFSATAMGMLQLPGFALVALAACVSALVLTPTCATPSWGLVPVVKNSTQMFMTSGGSTVLTSAVLGPAELYEGSSVAIAFVLHQEPQVDSLQVRVVARLLTPSANFSLGLQGSGGSTTSVQVPRSRWNMTQTVTLSIDDDSYVNTVQSSMFEVTFSVDSNQGAIAFPSTSTDQLRYLGYIIEQDVGTCAKGKYAREVLSTLHMQCIDCQAGRYQDTVGNPSSCTACPADTFLETRGAMDRQSCNICPHSASTYGEVGVSSASQCTCKAGYYPRFEEDSRVTSANAALIECRECPVGAVCSRPNSSSDLFKQEAWMKSEKDYWRIPWSSNVDTSYIRCVSKDVCLDQDRCAPGHEGVMCDVCVEGHYKSFGECISCGKHTIMLRLGIIGGVLFVICSTFYLLRKQIHKYKNAWRDMLRVIKINLDFWQVNSSMPSVLNVSFPTAWLRFMGPFSVLNFDLVSFAGLTCIPGVNFYTTFIVIAALPIFGIIMGFLRFMCRKCMHQSIAKASKHMTADELHKQLVEGLRFAFYLADTDNSGMIDVHEFGHLVRRLGHSEFTDKQAAGLFHKHSKDNDHFLTMDEFLEIVLDSNNKVHIDYEVVSWSKERRNLYQSFATVSQVLVLVHTPVARYFFQFFNCEDIESHRYLKLDRSISCDAAGYKQMSGIVSLVGVIFVMGFPLAIMGFLFRHRKELYAVRVTDMIGFLYDRFNRGAEFWELHELIRKMLLTGVNVFLGFSPVLQVLISSIICVMAQVNLNFFRPHRNPVVFYIAEVTFAAITLKFLLALLITGHSEHFVQNSMIGAILIVVDIIVTVFGVFGMVAAFWLLYRKLRVLDGTSKGKQKVIPVDAKRSMEQRAESLEAQKQHLESTLASSERQLLDARKEEDELKNYLRSQLARDEVLKRKLQEKEGALQSLREAQLKLEADMAALSASKSAADSKVQEESAELAELKMRCTMLQHKANLEVQAAHHETDLTKHELESLQTELQLLKRQNRMLEFARSASGGLRFLLNELFMNAASDDGFMDLPALRRVYIQILGEASGGMASDVDADTKMIFDALDRDGSGTIDFNEFADWIARGLERPKGAREAWAMRSPQNTRLNNFLVAVIVRMRAVFLGRLYCQFAESDGAGAQQITLTGLVRLLETMQTIHGMKEDMSQEASVIMQSLDADANGIIEEREFVTWVETGLGRSTEERQLWRREGGTAQRLEQFLQCVTLEAKRYGLAPWCWSASLLAGGETGASEVAASEGGKVSTDKSKTLAEDDVVTSVSADHLKVLFQKYDADSDGTLNRKELHQLVKDSVTCQTDSMDYDWVDDDVVAIENALDSDRDGRIQQAEFVTWILQGAARPKREREHWAKQGGVFQRLDCLLTGAVTIALRIASEAGEGENKPASVSPAPASAETVEQPPQNPPPKLPQKSAGAVATVEAAPDTDSGVEGKENGSVTDTAASAAAPESKTPVES